MKQRDNISIGDIYGSMLNSVKRNLKESKETKPFEEPKIKGKNGTGPDEVDGYNKALNDPDFKDEDEESEQDADDVSKYLPKRHRDLDKLQNKLKDPDTDEKSKEHIKKELKLRQGEEAEEDERDDDYSKEDWEEKFRKEKSGKWSERDIDAAIKKESGDNDEDEEIQESKKNSTKILNNFMSKSTFDKLYSKVLRENFGQEDDGGDIDALGLDDATPDSDLGDDFGDETGEEDSVTFTLDRATAQTLIDVLQGALGEGDEGLEGEGDELDFGDEDEGEGGEDEGSDLDFDREDEEVQGTKVAPDKKAVFQGKSNKVGGKVVPHKSKAKSDVTDDVGDDGDYGHAISSPKKPNMGTDNKVNSTIKGRGQEFFR